MGCIHRLCNKAGKNLNQESKKILKYMDIDFYDRHYLHLLNLCDKCESMFLQVILYVHA